MRKKSGRVFRRVVLILFLGVVVACGFAVLYLGTSTGLTFGGSATRIAGQVKSYPVYGQAGWFRNTAPWPITIKSVTTNVQNASASPTVYLIPSQTPPLKQSSKEPGWATTASTVPFQLNGGALRYLGFSFAPRSNEVAAMSTITVTYSGPLGFTFHKTFSGTRIATASSALPPGLLGVAPYGNPGSLDAYIVALRAALTSPDPKTVALVMGNNATQPQAEAFITSQKAYTATDSVTAYIETKDGRQQRITFYQGDPTKGALPPIEVVWANYRWTIRASGS
jgi:hypothetical protein